MSGLCTLFFAISGAIGATFTWQHLDRMIEKFGGDPIPLIWMAPVFVMAPFFGFFWVWIVRLSFRMNRLFLPFIMPNGRPEDFPRPERDVLWHLALLIFFAKCVMWQGAGILLAGAWTNGRVAWHGGVNMLICLEILLGAGYVFRKESARMVAETRDK